MDDGLRQPAASSAADVAMGELVLSVVVPTFNESKNVVALVESLEACLANCAWEVIFVDDNSPDRTAALVREIARTRPHVRCLQRFGRRGLSSAVIEGIASSSAPFVAVIDGDMQHDETLLPRMLGLIAGQNLDLIVGSRYVSGGSISEWSAARRAMSKFATRLSALIMQFDLTDPMSGFFMVRREAFIAAAPYLSGAGYKILLDFVASAPTPLRHRELPYEFRPRLHGESKIDAMVLFEYLMLLVEKTVGRYIPVRFLLFCLVGGSGVLVHLATLFPIKELTSFAVAQAIAALVSMTSNFALNNILTYRDCRLRGRKLVTGLLSFYAVCSIGFLANVSFAQLLFERGQPWWIAGTAGVLIGSVWNFGASSIFTWKRA
ncbi:MAG: glycosyltransferase family 2 protein [Rhodospirillaceae bacterium]